MVVVEPLILASYILGYIFKDTGIPIPGIGYVKVWEFLIKNNPQTAWEIAMENVILWVVPYSIAHFLMYIKPQRSFFHPFKLNPNYPPSSQVMKEIFRSLRAITICTVYCVMVNQFHSFGYLPSGYVPSLFDNDGLQVSIFTHFLGMIVIFLWCDFHFYWTHRLLHSPWFYKKVHKIHHESFNPDPFSAHSMHWIESAIFFTAAPVAAFVAPLHMFRSIVIGLIVFPLEGHWGFGDWTNKGSVHHYIHHSKFNWNYGTSPLWDHLMGTNYPDQRRKMDQKRDQQAKEQAAIVQCNIGEDFKDCPTHEKSK